MLQARIASKGAMRFPDFMATALYHPELGYYARSARQVGRGGDFFTSVSVGPLFGELLARRFLREWEDSGAPGRWRIIECGAHDGRLAADLLGVLRRLGP
jgi:SAM-dependent MidA family methyltransferase